MLVQTKINININIKYYLVQTKIELIKFNASTNQKGVVKLR